MAEDRPTVFLKANNERTGGDWKKDSKREILIRSRQKISVRMVKHRNKMPYEAVESPSMEIKLN